MKKWAVFLFILVNMLDIYTTLLPGGSEGNPMMRDMNQHPVLGHIIWIKIAYTIFYSVIALIGWAELRRYTREFADLYVVAIFLYISWDFIDVLVKNYVIYLGWYN